VSKTYYEVLGVPRNAGELEIKAAYHRLARKYHPDKAASAAEASSMEKEFSEISTAYNILKDKDKRSGYDQSLEAKRQQQDTPSGPMPKATGGVTNAMMSASASGQSAAANEKNRANVAKRAYIKGAQLAQTGEFAKAAEFFEVAIKNNEEESLYHAKLAQTLLRNQRSFSRATEAAQRAIDLDPYNSEYRIILAELYENAGSTSMAVRTYEEIMKWDPDNQKAKVALSVLAPRRKGLLGKLFGRKSS
jgi:curved DNA-binding protein CbpA